MNGHMVQNPPFKTKKFKFDWMKGLCYPKQRNSSLTGWKRFVIQNKEIQVWLDEIALLSETKKILVWLDELCFVLDVPSVQLALQHGRFCSMWPLAAKGLFFLSVNPLSYFYAIHLLYYQLP